MEKLKWVFVEFDKNEIELRLSGKVESLWNQSYYVQFSQRHTKRKIETKF